MGIRANKERNRGGLELAVAGIFSEVGAGVFGTISRSPTIDSGVKGFSGGIVFIII